MPETIVARVDCLPDAQRRVVSERYCQQEIPPRRVFALRYRQYGWNDRRSRMQRRAFVDVVEFQDVRRHAVGECRPRSRPPARRKHRRVVRCPEPCGHSLRHPRRRFDRACERRAKPVEDRPLSVLHRFGRQIFESRGRQEPG
jgi:hypothetical protein